MDDGTRPAHGRLSDEVLFARAMADDGPAWEELTERHYPRIVALAARILGDRHEAEDVATETLTRIWQRSGQFNPARGKLKSWMLRIAARLALDKLRNRKRRPQSLADPKLYGADKHDTTPDHRASRDTSKDLNAAMTQLRNVDEKSWAVAHLKSRGFTFAQIKESLGMPTSTAHKRWKRACAFLRRAMGDPGSDR